MCGVCLEAWGPRELCSDKVSPTEMGSQESHFRKRQGMGRRGHALDVSRHTGVG